MQVGSKPTKRDRPRIQTLARADAILAVVAGAEAKPVKLAEIADTTQLHKNTVFTILQSLEQLRFVSRDPATKGYRIGARFFELAKVAEGRLAVADVARPVMYKLLALANESVSVAVPGTFDAIIVSTIESTFSVRGTRHQGQHAPFHASAVGKAMLAHMPDTACAAILDHAGLKRNTRNSITDRESLQRELKQVRARGYAVSIEEEEVGANAVGAPILDRMGEVRGAIAIWGPATRLPRARLAELGPTISVLCRGLP